MKPEESPGIAFLGVKLLRLDFHFRGKPPEKIPASLTFAIKADIIQGKRLLLHVDVDAFGGVPEDERPDIDLSFTLAGVFEKTTDEGMPLSEFAEYMAPAHLVPYVRELIANITTRSPLPTLNIGPINVRALVERGESTFSLQEEKKEERQA